MQRKKSFGCHFTAQYGAQVIGGEYRTCNVVDQQRLTCAERNAQLLSEQQERGEVRDATGFDLDTNEATRAAEECAVLFKLSVEGEKRERETQGEKEREGRRGRE